MYAFYRFTRQLVAIAVATEGLRGIEEVYDELWLSAL